MRTARLVFAIGLVVALACSACGGDAASPSDVGPDADTPSNLPGWEIRLGGGEDTPTNLPDLPPELVAPDLVADIGWAPEPCQEDADCDSGYCLWTPTGSVCTIPCIEECPEGWACKPLAEAWPDVILVCVPLFQYLCNPCATDAQCNPPGVGGGARCVTIAAGGSFCAEPCAGAAAECPTGASCSQQHVNLDGAPLCVPDADCWCTPYAADMGLATDCALENAYGTCVGTRSCSEAGLSTCDAAVPKAEVCDGADDDCDGAIDEELGTKTCGQGPCAHEVPACVDGEAGPCDPLAGATTETCDGVDEDCDGETDEALGTITCGDGACQVTVPACMEGVPNDCEGQALGSDEICNGADDDCDGEIDEDLGDITCGDGACLHTVDACVDGAPQFCNPFEGASAEVCNGIDDDCDGAADDGLGETTCGQGACLQTVPNCQGGVPRFCNPFEGAGLEICNGLDDDCDGPVDEGLGTTSCGQGVCAHTVTACIDGVPQPCDPFEGAGQEACNGQDDDCDGAVDDGLGSIVCGAGPCQVTLPACVDGQAQSCDGLGQGGQEVCNGEDDDCDGSVDEEGALNCLWYHADKDLDGWGDDLDKKCLCGPDLYYTELQGGDCYDLNGQARPGQQGWFGEDRGDGLFDYNCDGQETYFWPNISACSNSCPAVSVGWLFFKPPCGVDGTLATNCTMFMGICDYYMSTVTAECH